MHALFFICQKACFDDHFDERFLSAASTTARISASTAPSSPSFNAPILMTMSTSVAPFEMASFVSNAFVSDVVAPRGNPITVQTSTPVPFSSSAASLTQVGFTQTEANLYSFASFISCKISAFVYAVSKQYGLFDLQLTLYALPFS